jgi:hypothetical protein
MSDVDGAHASSPDRPSPAAAGPAGSAAPEVFDPARLLRIAGVTREVLEETRRIRPGDDGAIEHLRTVHGQICDELRRSLPEALYHELDELTPDLRDGSLEELALGHAEILGWLEGLFQGTQLAIQVRAMESARPGALPASRPSPGSEAAPDATDSQYL